MNGIRRLADGIDALVLRIGAVFAWLNLLLVAVILLQVVLRYGFRHASVPLEELMWQLFGAAFMFGLSYALVRDEHIRVDLLSARFPARVNAAIEMFGLLFLLLPLVLVVTLHSIDWVALSWRLDEASVNPTGLPHRWIIKSVIPLAMGLLGLAAVARLLRQFDVLLHGRR